MEYDLLNQMAHVTAGTTEAYYQYSGGQRVRKYLDKGSFVTEERIYYGAYEVYRKWSGTALSIERTTLHVADDSGRIAMIEQRTVGTSTSDGGTAALLKRFIYSNHLQSASLELDETGAIISYEEYHPYGTTAYQAMNSAINAVAKRYRYTGKERDEESGLNYHGARYYALWLCRWCVVDPLESKYTPLSSYNYCENNPVNATDSTGKGPDKNAITVNGHPKSSVQIDSHDTPTPPHADVIHIGENTAPSSNKSSHHKAKHSVKKQGHSNQLKGATVTAHRMSEKEVKLHRFFNQNILPGLVPYINSGIISRDAAYKKFEEIINAHMPIHSSISNEKTNLPEARIRAFLRMIRVGEGTVGERGYETLYGNSSFIKDHGKDWSTHPQTIIHKGKFSSSAAGAYQIMGYTYKDLGGSILNKNHKVIGYNEHHNYIKKYDIKDFSPASQDMLAVVILRHKDRGALDMIAKGDLKSALDITSYEWASLPDHKGTGRYPPQHTQDVSKVYERYNNYLQDELNGKSDLHLSNGFLHTFGY